MPCAVIPTIILGPACSAPMPVDTFETPSETNMPLSHRQTALSGLLTLFALQSAFAVTSPSDSPHTLEQAMEQARSKLTHRAAASLGAAGALDVKPPVIERFNMRGSIDAWLEGSSVTAELTMSDDLSGISGYGLQMTGPSGQLVYQWINPGNPQHRRINVDLAFGGRPYADVGFTRFSEPGTWRASDLYVFDNAGNTTRADVDQLALLGNVEVKVNNTAGFDATAPELVRGRILTDAISLSKSPRGNPSGLPVASVVLAVKDSGSGQAAGVRYASLQFCVVDGAGACTEQMFGMFGTTAEAGLKAGAIEVGSTLPADLAPGTYELVGAWLRDAANNEVWLDTPGRGGSTDFGRLFPSGTSIRVKP